MGASTFEDRGGALSTASSTATATTSAGITDLTESNTGDTAAEPDSMFKAARFISRLCFSKRQMHSSEKANAIAPMHVQQMNSMRAAVAKWQQMSSLA